MMKIKKFGALLVSAVLCIGMAAPAFAYEGDTTPVEEPVLPEIVEEEDAVTITDEEMGADDSVSGTLFSHGVCMPSDTKMDDADLTRVCDVVKALWNE